MSNAENMKIEINKLLEKQVKYLNFKHKKID